MLGTVSKLAVISLILSVSVAAACGGKDEQRNEASGEVSEAPIPAEPASAPAPVDNAAAPGEPEIAIPNARMFEGHLLGGQPSPDQLRAAADAGYKTVIELQTGAEPGVAELEATIEELGLDYVHIPIAGTDGLDENNARALNDALARGGKEGKVMVVCRSGNRVGALFALRAHYVEGCLPSGLTTWKARRPRRRWRPAGRPA
jgi:uncharacterized protein (TIGR01244 family)